MALIYWLRLSSVRANCASIEMVHSESGTGEAVSLYAVGRLVKYGLKFLFLLRREDSQYEIYLMATCKLVAYAYT